MNDLFHHQVSVITVHASDILRDLARNSGSSEEARKELADLGLVELDEKPFLAAFRAAKKRKEEGGGGVR